MIRATIIAIFIALPVKTYADFLNILPKRTILQEYFQDGEYDLAFNLAENLSAESDPGLPHRSGPTRMLGLASVSSGVMPPFLYRAE